MTTLRHQESFGWANGFVVDRRAEVSIAFEAQWVRWAMLGGALVDLAPRDLALAAHPGAARPVDPAAAEPRAPGAHGAARPARRARRRGVLVGAGVSVDEPVLEEAPERTRRRARQVRRGPVLFVVVVALVAAVVAQQNESSGSSASTAGGATAARALIGVPAADVASSTWYCAAGTSSPDGGATETLVIASLARTDIEVTITVMPGGDTAPATDRMRLAPGEEVNVPVADVLATAEPGVTVESVGGPAAVSHVLEHDGDVAVESCTRTAEPDWYFASGTTLDGSAHYLAAVQPVRRRRHRRHLVRHRHRRAGARRGCRRWSCRAGRASPSRCRTRCCDRRGVAAHVHARSGRVVAEQTQTFTDVVIDGATRSGIALSAGATAPASTWWIPAGSTATAAEPSSRWPTSRATTPAST